MEEIARIFAARSSWPFPYQAKRALFVGTGRVFFMQELFGKKIYKALENEAQYMSFLKMQQFKNDKVKFKI